jgi:putative ABC transport system permease protein
MANSEIRAAFRIFYREKFYALINLAGLSLALACCLILGLYLRSELTYEQHNLKYRQIYRVVHAFTHSGPPDRLAMTQIPLGIMLKENYSEIKDCVRFIAPSQKVLIRSDDRVMYWENVYSTDENVFEIFTHKILYGDPKTALKDPASAAVSETFAKNYFGDSNPIGKTIHPEAGNTIAGTPRKITLVFRDPPQNTHMKYDVLFRWVDPPNIRRVLLSVRSFTYLLMPENYNINSFKAISNSFFKRFMEPELKVTHSTWECWLQPLTDIHLHSDLIFDLPTGNRYYVYGFAVVALFILQIKAWWTMRKAYWKPHRSVIFRLRMIL